MLTKAKAALSRWLSPATPPPLVEGRDCRRVDYPAHFADGDGVEIFVRRDETHATRLVLTDLGLTWMRLSTRREIGPDDAAALAELAGARGVQVDGCRALIVETDPDRVTRAALTMALVQIETDAVLGRFWRAPDVGLPTNRRISRRAG